MIYLFLLLPVAWFLQNVIHEVSHLLVGWLVEGRKPKKLIPWPNKVNGKWLFASYVCGPKTKDGSPAWRHIAPLIFAFSLFLIMFVLFVCVGHLALVSFWLCPLVDAAVWIFGYKFKREGTDGLKFRQITNNPS